MPRVSDFYGITISLYFQDHNPPHFHATYGEFEATLLIETGDRLSGALPSRALALVLDWLALHRVEVRENWVRARQQLPLTRIAPLP